MADQKQTILLIEDDRYLSKAADLALSRHGYKVVTGRNGEEGLQLANEISPDLILLDLIMPKMQGFEVLKNLKLRESTARIPVLVMSNLGQEEDRKQAMEGGAVDYLIKANITTSELALKVDRTLLEMSK
jgi:two-component system alkaline phosphatase synthesis response regulator PhoP